MSIPFTYLYLIYDPFTKLSKIGRSDDPIKRLKQLNASSGTILAAPQEYKLIQMWQVPLEMELEIHDQFAEDRIRGEWFELSTEQYQELNCRLWDYHSWLAANRDVAIQSWGDLRECRPMRANLFAAWFNDPLFVRRHCGEYIEYKISEEISDLFTTPVDEYIKQKSMEMAETAEITAF